MPRRGRNYGHTPEQRPPGRLPFEHGDVPGRVRRGGPDARELLLVRSGLRRDQPRSHIPAAYSALAAWGFFDPMDVVSASGSAARHSGARGARGPRIDWGSGNLGQDSRPGWKLRPGAAGARKRQEDLRPHGRRRPDQGTERRGRRIASKEGLSNVTALVDWNHIRSQAPLTR